MKKRTEDVYKYIKRYMLKNGVIPSIREICIGVGMSSTSSVHGHIMKLEEEGLIERYEGNRYTVKGMRYVEECKDSE